jgi:hypothetical protein
MDRQRCQPLHSTWRDGSVIQVAGTRRPAQRGFHTSRCCGLVWISKHGAIPLCRVELFRKLSKPSQIFM